METKSNFPKGSEWRKWDLHVHTPFSLVNHYEGSNDEEKWGKFISDLENLPCEFKVIGINDYLFIDGYRKVLEYKNNGRLKNIELILPVIEFRIDKFAGHKEFKKVNFHVIFSNELTIDVIEQQFLNALSSKFKLSSGLNGITWGGIITKNSLEDLGKKIKKTLPQDRLKDYGSDLEEGFNNLCLDENDIFKLLNENTYLKDKYLTAIGKTEWESLSWNDQSIAIKKDIINKVDIVFISSENIDKYKKAKDKLKEQNVNSLLLDCSDSHYNIDSSEKDRIGKCFTWIKADPTFEGLKQIIYEPEERVFIGDVPEIITRVRENKTKFIKTIKINQNNNYNGDKGVWFKDISIDLNPGLVAIIGNKGNGKSALTDIIALCGNSHRYEDFSFLRKDRFLKDGLAENFYAELHWESDNDIIKRTLNESTDKNAPERVKYLPQNFFEKLTNDLEAHNFEKTLEEVVFSYIPEEERSGKKSFPELIDYKKKINENELTDILSNISRLNKSIIELEKKSHHDYKKQIEERLKQKKKELEEHEKNKPKEVVNPEKDERLTDDLKKKQDELNKLNSKLEILENNIVKTKEELSEINSSINELNNIKQELEDLKSRYEEYLKGNYEIFSKYGLNINEIIKVEINIDIIKNKIEEFEDQRKQKKEKLYTEQDIDNLKISNDEKNNLKNQSFTINKENITQQIDEIKNQLSEPQKKYQQYLEDLKRWENRKKEIEGDESTPETLKCYENELKYLDNNLPNDLKKQREDRIQCSLNIFEKKKEIVEIYKNLKDKVNEEIEKFENILGEYQIQIDASLKIKSNFSEEILHFINQRVKGSFYGLDEGKHVIEKLVKEKDINTENGIKSLLEEIIEYLEFDMREEVKNEKRNIKDQILNEEKWLKFYEYLFSLEYIEPIYQLKLGNKNINQLSPGEKGALLIVFYLLLEKENIPLIIDQPEENLDNETVYKILTHFIRYAKKRRQVIIVTLNPNLAIVGDAEQLIFVKIDKTNNNTFHFKSGSIENPDINKHASDILEGTLQAFDIRRLKYLRKTLN